MKKKIICLGIALSCLWGMAFAQQTCTLTLHVTSVTGEDMGGTPFYLERVESGLVYNRVLGANGTYVEKQIYPGIHHLRIEKEGLKTYDNPALDIQEDMTLDIVMEEPVRTPYNLLSTLAHDPKTGANDVSLVWNEETDYFFDDFENYTSFTLNLEPWTGIDKDQAEAAVLMQGDYPNCGLKQYATIVSPDEVYLSVADGEGNPYQISWWYYAPQLRAYSGKKYMGFIRTSSGTTNNDWAITPQIHVGVNNVVRFKAKAADAPTEKFKVWISTTGTDEDNFTPLTQGNYEAVTWEQWSTIEYDLSKYEGQDVYIAVQYITQAGWMLMVDDFFVGPSKLNPSSIKARLPKARRIMRKTAASDEPQSYKVYLDGDEVESVQTNTYVFKNITAGTHTLGVKSVYKVSESDLATTQIEVPDASAYADVKVRFTTNGGSTEGVAVNYISGSYQVTDTIKSGLSQFSSLKKGEYIIGVNDDRFEQLDTLINIDKDMEINLELVEKIVEPYNLSVDFSYRDADRTTDVLFRWNQDLGWEEGFEEYDDFATQFGGWITFDQDRQRPYGITLNNTLISFPGLEKGESPVVVFNPETTTPPCNEDVYLNTLFGKKYIMFFGVQSAKSDDWLITPKQKINAGYVADFYIHIYPGLQVYPETIEVLASTGSQSDLTSFVPLYRETFTEGGWYEVTINLDEYVNQEIYLAINYISDDGWMLKVDNFYVGPSSDAPAPEVGDATYDVYLNGEEKASAITDNFYTFEALADGTYTAGVKAKYESGETKVVEYLFTTQYSGVDNVVLPEVKVYGHDRAICIESISGKQWSATVYNAAGQPVATTETLEGSTQIPVAPGFYLVQLSTEQGTHTVKVLVK